MRALEELRYPHRLLLCSRGVPLIGAFVAQLLRAPAAGSLCGANPHAW